MGRIKYSFCESVTATSFSPWHIRKLTDAGRKLTGGIDTDSLCERVKASCGGWDLRVEITKSQLSGTHICKTCLIKFAESP